MDIHSLPNSWYDVFCATFPYNVSVERFWAKFVYKEFDLISRNWKDPHLSFVQYLEISNAIYPTLCWNCVFPQNFHTRKLLEITVFYTVSSKWYRRNIYWAKFKKSKMASFCNVSFSFSIWWHTISLMLAIALKLSVSHTIDSYWSVILMLKIVMKLCPIYLINTTLQT